MFEYNLKDRMKNAPGWNGGSVPAILRLPREIRDDINEM
jgi:hypothetical protein